MIKTDDINALHKLIQAKLGDKPKRRKLPSITLQEIIACFLWKNRRRYIGIDWNLFKEGTYGYALINEFLNFVAGKARRWWTPFWFLNLLHLFGRDNSIVRCRNIKIFTLCSRLTNGIMVTDIKEKWGTLRIYGNFTQEIEDRLKELQSKINPMLEAY